MLQSSKLLSFEKLGACITDFEMGNKITYELEDKVPIISVSNVNFELSSFFQNAFEKGEKLINEGFFGGKTFK